VVSPQRLPMIAAGLCGTAMVVGCVVAAVAAFNLSNTNNAPASSIEEQPAEALSAVAQMTAIAEGSLQESSQPEALASRNASDRSVSGQCGARRA